MLRSALFAGDPLLAAVDRDEERISLTRNATAPAVALIQTALLSWDPQALPAGHPHGTFDAETSAAVRRFKLELMGLAPNQIIDGVGRLTVQRLDEVRLATEQPPPGHARVRRDVWSLAPQHPADAWDPLLLAYAKAVAAMKQRPAEDPTSWVFQAAIHGSHRVTPPGAQWNQCQHQGWYFLPWHRMYLYFFERIVTAAVVAQGGPADFALPYWDAERPFPATSMPIAYRVRTLPDGSPNPLYVAPPGRNPAWEQGATVPVQVSSSVAAMAVPNYVGPPGAGFGGGRTAPAFFAGRTGALELSPHNGLHPLIGGAAAGSCQGGLMTDPQCAALDPVFWLHHANVDRLWSRWLDPAVGGVNPADAAWLDQTFTLYDESGADVRMAVAQVLEPSTGLGYGYDDDPAQAAAGEPAAAAAASRSRRRPVSRARPEPPTLGAATVAPVRLTGRVASARLTAPASTAALVASAPDHPGRVYLHLDDIEAEADPGVVYAVYLNLPAGADDEQRLRHHVGTLSLFGIVQANDPDRVHSGVPGFQHVFDVTEQVRAMARESGWDPDQAAVSFEPLGPVLPAGPDGEQPAAAALPDEHDPIRIGRVALFFGAAE
jgi:hypothetical protein